MFTEVVEGVTIAYLQGELDGNTAPQVQEDVLALIGPRTRLLLDMTELDFMSSAGARTLLMIYRQINSQDSAVILVGLNSEIEDMLSVTGFLNYFDVVATVEDGLEAFGV